MDGLLQLIIMIAIPIAIALAVLAMIALALAATAACGSVYGSFKAMVCYSTALKRTYGSDPDYEATTSLKVVVALILASPIAILILILVLLSL